MNKPFIIKAVLFDFDGALIRGGSSCSVPDRGAEDLLLYLRSRGLGIGIISLRPLRLIRESIKHLEDIHASDFDLIISADGPIRPKPGADWIPLAAQNLNIDIAQLLVLGDGRFYGQAGQTGEAVTVLWDEDAPSMTSMSLWNYRISRLGELKKIVRLGLPLSAGKLPNKLLEEFLGKLEFQDPSLLIMPAVGEDTAALDVAKDEVLVLKTDPITFVTESIGYYAVIVNANDVATSGATPRWLLTTLLFPSGTTPSEIWHVMHDLKEVCRKWGITLCGGHTEITDAVTRPIVIGTLAGTVRRDRLIDKRNMTRGDKILLTKAVSVEGTAIIAMEFENTLKALGMGEREISECRGLLSSISILEEAGIARNSQGVTALHDVTEGGLATALDEFGAAGGHRIRVRMDKIPYFPQTVKLCRLLGIDPLGLIGSGSLIISCRREDSRPLISKICGAGIQITCIGEVLGKGQGVEALERIGPVEWPRFEVDEITRLS